MNKIYEIRSNQFEIDGKQQIQINSRKIMKDLNGEFYAFLRTNHHKNIAYKTE